MDQVSHEACDNYDTKISTKKTEVENQPTHSEPTITVTRQRLQHLADCVDISGTKVESGLTQS